MYQIDQSKNLFIIHWKTFANPFFQISCMCTWKIKFARYILVIMQSTWYKMNYLNLSTVPTNSYIPVCKRHILRWVHRNIPYLHFACIYIHPATDYLICILVISQRSPVLGNHYWWEREIALGNKQRVSSSIIKVN